MNYFAHCPRVRLFFHLFILVANATLGVVFHILMLDNKNHGFDIHVDIHEKMAPTVSSRNCLTFWST